MKKIRIASLQGPMDKLQKPITIEKNLEWTQNKILELSRFHVDIICLAEVFSLIGIDGKKAEKAEPVSGPTIELMMKLAKKHKLAIICPIPERRKNKIYNTAVVINKSGKIVGQYDKIHPTEDELEDGIVSGKTTPMVINLDGVKIGCQICFDANWPGDWMNLKQAGAQIIFFCSAFSAGTLLAGYAATLSVPIVAATLSRYCRIYDRTGKMIVHQSPYYDYAIADVLIDQPLFHLDYQFDLVEKVRKECPDVTVDIFDGEGRWTIRGCDDPKRLQAIITKYKLMDVDSYFARAKRKQDIHR